MEFAGPRDSTFFRHIDMTVPDYLATDTKYCIRYMSLNDEMVDACTENLPSFLERLRNGASWLRTGKHCRGSRMNMEKVSSAENAAVFGNLTPVLCSKGHVRFTRLGS